MKPEVAPEQLHSRHAGEMEYEPETVHTENEATLAVKKLNQELELHVAERTTELLAYTRELEAFSYSVSHDLCAPLRTINGFSNALLEDHSGSLDEQGLDYLTRIIKGVGRMAGLIDDLLNLSMITRREINIEKIDVSEIAREISAAYSADYKAEFIIKDGIFVIGDLGLVRIAMENLICNALKYSSCEPDPKVVVEPVDVNNLEYISVSDNGVGFDMAYSSKLFIPFQRLHSDAKFIGNGIGLALVQRIINKHGGEIWARSEPGKGAVFTFRFMKLKSGNPVIEL
jgi:signal transduction histidine kinase